MGNIRRVFVQGAPVFVTAVCHSRTPLLRPSANKALLLAAMREVKAIHPYRMSGYVILDDHFHWLVVPAVAEDLPAIMQKVKLRFARRVLRTGAAAGPRVWQPRYWDHVIRDADDLQRHLDYIHFNPVRHGYRNAPGDYPYSSFSEYRRRGCYSDDWGVSACPDGIDELVPE